MPRTRGMVGPGSRKMGGAGVAAGRPPTPMAGGGLGAPKGGPAAAMGAPPMAPKVANVRPPGLGAGAPPPMPGGGMGGPPPPPPGGMGGSGGFARGGKVEKMDERKDDRREERKHEEHKAEERKDDRKEERHKFAKGGSVGIGGGDTKARHKSEVHKGRG